LEELIKLAEKNSAIDIKRGEEKFLSVDWAINELISEIDEVRAELKPDNIPYLEDELGDILWGWFMLVANLKQKGLITNHQNIINRVKKKYKERISSLKGDVSDRESWRAVKAKQKIELEEELQKLLEATKE